jgi:hypothetical protein
MGLSETRSSFLKSLCALALASACLGAGVSYGQTPPLPDELPAPAQKPAPPEDEAAEPEDGGRAESPPLPTQRPARGDTHKQPESVDTDPKPDTLPPAELACRHRLRALGVEFVEVTPIDEPEGCEAAHPISVSRLSDTVELSPAAVLTCPMAEATARFVRDRAVPLVEKEFESRLETLHQVSGYVCRPRNGTDTLSEHAFANALDWGALELADGEMIEIQAYQRSEPRRARLLSALRQAACGPFKTVLGPGTDADHADHFHFDLAERRNGGTYCR